MRRYYAVCEWALDPAAGQYVQGPLTLEELLGYIGRNCDADYLKSLESGASLARVVAVIAADRIDEKSFPYPKKCLDIKPEE